MLWDQKTDDSFHNSQNDAPPLSNDQRPRSRPRPIRALEILAGADEKSGHGCFQVHVRASDPTHNSPRTQQESLESDQLTYILHFQDRRLLPSLDRHPLLARCPLLAKSLQRPRHAQRLNLERS
jgi:hypothetical protein